MSAADVPARDFLNWLASLAVACAVGFLAGCVVGFLAGAAL